MKILIMGTGAGEGIPGVFCNCPTCQMANKLGGKEFRTRSQALIDDKLLIDFGMDTYMHFLREHRTLYNIENVLVTHSHSDHLSSDELFNRNPGFALGRTTQKLNFYCNETVRDLLRSRYSYEFLIDNYIFNIVEDYKAINVDKYLVTPMPAIHSAGENPHIYLIENDGKAILYCLDTGIIKEDTMYNWLKENNKHIDVVIFDCTKGAIERNYYVHMSMSENAYMKDRFMSAGVCDNKTKFISSHFSHYVSMQHAELEKEGAKLGLTVAYDGMIVTTD